MSERLRLGVNIDHVATVRNARGGDAPSPIRAAEMAVAACADGISPCVTSQACPTSLAGGANLIAVQRLRTVAGRVAGRAETSRNIAPPGGSSSVFNSVFAA